MKTSVCMAVYNGEAFLFEQIDGILAQLSINDELIIVDDNSSDQSSSIIKEFCDTRILYHRNTNNIGVVRTFSQAIKMSSGDIILLSDQDDIWMAGRIDFFKDQLKNKNFKLIVTDAYILQQGEVALDSLFSIRRSGSGLIKNFIFNSFVGCCMGFTSDLKKYILPMPPKITMHDQWIGIMAQILGSVEFRRERFTVYRRHDHNVTQLRSLNIRQIISNRLNYIRMIILAVQIKLKLKYE